MSADLRPYDRYKDSGVEWLGEVPEHWEVKRLKFVAELELSNVDKKALDGEQEVKLCNYTDVYYNDRIHDDLSFMHATASRDQIERLSLTNGDVVITKDSEDPHDIGVPTYVNSNVRGLVCGYHLAILRSRGNAFGLFLFHFFASDPAREWFAQEARGLTRFGLGKHSIENTELPVPPVPEQEAIAAYLDSETARIDTLISEQQELIDLLKEKRQALISHCVTKGLDPSVPMKDSGVEWIGSIPAHWNAIRVTLVANLESGHTPSRNRPDFWVNCDTPWFTLADIWQIRKEGRKYVHSTEEMVSSEGLAHSSARVLPAGTVILSRTASVGYCAIASCDLATSQDFANWICTANLYNVYLYYCFLGMRKEFDRLKMGSTHQTIYMPDIRSLIGPVPPLSEQKAIADYLDRKTARIDALIAEAEETIALMQEHRSALISAAVTGKVKVPGVEEATAEAATATAGAG